MEGKFVQSVNMIDPDTKLEVTVRIYKLANGAVVGIDESFIANTDDNIYSPYELGVELNLDI